MNSKKSGIHILVVALSLATAWAIRGQFGHEQGAAWAGAVGGLALVLVSQRKDWYNKIILVALASAIGWGAGGMISYGVVVGYGRADNFVNAFYGLSMLFVIGALFGLLGGGLVGLVLESTEKNKVKWGAVIAEMVTGGLISYYFLVEQIGVKMTPPRSEAWAIVLGAGIALLLHMARNKRNSAIRVAIFSALGGGFGFGFGNFLQVLGHVYEVQFNMWNVMEYSIGFFGGTGMAYGVFSSVWPQDEAKPEKWVNRVAMAFVVVFIPVMIYRESLSFTHFLSRLEEIPNLESVALNSSIVAAVVILTMGVLLFRKFLKVNFEKKDIAIFLLVYLGVYTFISYLISGLFAGNTELNHHLYVLNIILIYVLYKKQGEVVFYEVSNKINAKKWFVFLLAILVCLAICALIAISIHGELSGSHNRFPSVS